MNHVEHLNSVLCGYCCLERRIDYARAAIGKNALHWPAWCFLPKLFWHAIICENQQNPLNEAEFVDKLLMLSTICTWSYSLGVYRFAPPLLAALANSQGMEQLPCNLLQRLPEWSVYIETPGMNLSNFTLNGFWACLQWDNEPPFFALNLLLHSGSKLLAMPINLNDGIIASALNNMEFNEKNLCQQLGETLYSIRKIALGAVLYLCSENPLIYNAESRLPAYYQPITANKSIYHIPSSELTLWEVGDQAGVGAYWQHKSGRLCWV